MMGSFWVCHWKKTFWVGGCDGIVGLAYLLFCAAYWSRQPRANVVLMNFAIWVLSCLIMQLYSQLSLKYGNVWSLQCFARLSFLSAFLLYNLDFILLWNIVLKPFVLLVLSFSIVLQFLWISVIIFCLRSGLQCMFHIFSVAIYYLFKLWYGLHMIQPMHHNKPNISDLLVQSMILIFLISF